VLAANPSARPIAGGTDLVPNLRHGLDTPAVLVDVSRLDGADVLDVYAAGARIGAGVTLERLASDPRVAAALPAVAQAAASIAAPGHRSVGTVGGNLCVDTRCVWYNQSEWWRRSNGYCLKRGGEVCHVAPQGNRCHAAFSGDLAPALIACGASVEIAGPRGTRTIALEDLYRDDGRAYLALEPAELKALPAEEIVARLESAIGHDECAYLEAEPQEFESRRMAEHLELSLFMCPACGTIGRLKSFRSRFNCLACGEALALDGRYRFRRLGGGEPAFPTIRDWDAWQAKAFAAAAARAAAERPEAPFLSDPGALLLRGRKTRPLRRVRAGTLLLYRDRLELATHFGSRLSFPLAEIEGANVYKRNLLEFYVGRTLFQARFPLRATSARKWCMGIEALKAP